jgi:hypothetical protein
MRYGNIADKGDPDRNALYPSGQGCNGQPAFQLFVSCLKFSLSAVAFAMPSLDNVMLLGNMMPKGHYVLFPMTAQGLR